MLEQFILLLQASKEMLSMKKKEGDVPSFNFLFELLRGDH